MARPEANREKIFQVRTTEESHNLIEQMLSRIAAKEGVWTTKGAAFDKLINKLAVQEGITA